MTEQFTQEGFEEILRSIPDDQFRSAMHMLFYEKNRRDSQPLITAREDEIAQEYHKANPPEEDAETGHPVWVQPYGAHDAWPISATVVHNGTVWHNIAGVPNVWEPGNDGPVPTWQAQASEDPEDPEPGSQEWAEGVDYVIGDEVVYQGVTYRVIQDHTSAGQWTPDAVASLYEPQ